MDDTRDPAWEARRLREAERVLAAYETRGTRGLGGRYALTSPTTLMAVQERERHLLEQIARRSWALGDLDCLDVGCGTGGELARLIAYGAEPRRLHGVDLRPDAIAAAKDRLPLCDLIVGDGSELPFEDGSMDMVVQFTMLSSILDDAVRRHVAAEMVRVCRPAGLIVSYDFTINPSNPDTRGLGGDEIRGLFPGCRVSLRRLTLAPPLARHIAPRSRRLAQLVGTLPPLQTHLIAFITP